MNQIENPQLQLAFDFVQYTNKNIFLTGKAGTGKTTFLHNLKNVTPKRMVIVAPTGVAAINAGGVTIHSFFQMPFGPHIPGSTFSPDQKGSFNQRKMSKEKINLIKSLDLLVIDEISMVRADLLDGIDEVLRKYKDRFKPFGGAQLLMIGDLHQLSPVIKDDDWNMLKIYYDSIYFFSSKALQNTQPVNIELKHIYRQSDASFIEILNQVRNNNLDAITLKKLNDRYIPDFNPCEEDGYITLTTHNASALEINHSKLKTIKNASFIFSATIKDEFPEYAYPTEVKLDLKVGAQVMFVKNDTSWEKSYYNGKIGKILSISDELITVKCPTDEFKISVPRAEWENVKYTLDPDSKTINETVVGKFIQFPLKLAWAITIHKSQGLTFEKAIIDANASFAHGQVYVALSRCKTFEGLVLRSPISNSSIKTDGTISEFTNKVTRNEPGSQQLTQSKITYQKSLLLTLFDYKFSKYWLSQFIKIITENANIIDAHIISELNDIEAIADKEIFTVSEKFKTQLNNLFLQNNLPEGNEDIQDRVKKASIYFSTQTTNLLQKLKTIVIETDNKVVNKSIFDALEHLQKELFIKIAGLQSCVNGFSTIAYIQATANADIDFIVKSQQAPASKISVPKHVAHSELYVELKTWRDELAEQNDMIEYMIIPHKTILELVSRLPVTKTELKQIKGIGKAKIAQFGEEIISIISAYCEKNNIKSTQQEIIKKPKIEKPDTKTISFKMYQTGKSIDTIAQERNLAVTTIQSHLSHFVGTGDLNVTDFVQGNIIEAITEFLRQNQTRSLSAIKESFGDIVSYADLKFIFKHLENLENQK